MNKTSSVSRLEAKQKLAIAHGCINRWDTETTNVKQSLLDLLSTDAYAALGFDSKQALIKFLAKGSKKHRSTIYDMANAVLIEIEMDLVHGAMSTDALVCLREGTTQENRPEILALAKQFCNEKQRNPTKPMINKAKFEYFATQSSCFDCVEDDETEKRIDAAIDVEPPVNEKVSSKTKKKKEQLDIKGQLQSSDSYNQEQSDEYSQFPPAVLEIIKRVEKYTIPKMERLLKRLKPKHSVDIDAAKLLHLMDDDQLNKFKMVLDRNISINLS